VITAKKFRVTANNIWIGDIKYAGKDEMPAYIEDGMLLGIDAIETYAIIHKGEKNEVSED
jgi:hypothetical protein